MAAPPRPPTGPPGYGNPGGPPEYPPGNTFPQGHGPPGGAPGGRYPPDIMHAVHAAAASMNAASAAWPPAW